MRGSTLARGIAVATVAATAVFGFSILAGISTSASAREQDEVKTFKLTRGKLQITNFADFEKPAAVRIRDQEFTFGPELLRSMRGFVWLIETCSSFQMIRWDQGYGPVIELWLFRLMVPRARWSGRTSLIQTHV